MRKNVKGQNRKHSLRFEALLAKIDSEKMYEIAEAVKLVKETASTKMVESVDLSVKLGIDTRKGDQNVRGITTLPHGTGKVKKVAVLAKGDLAAAAEAAGADLVGADELISKIQAGEKDFDVLLATEEMAPQIGKIGRILGPRTPNKRNGTVTNNIAAAVKEIKGATRVEYRADKAGVVNMGIGKVNFTEEQITENLMAALGALIKAKPQSAKGKYVITITLSASMGPGIHIETSTAVKSAS